MAEANKSTEIKVLRVKLMRNRILIETLWHPEVKKYRTLIRLNHGNNLEKINCTKNDILDVL